MVSRRLVLCKVNSGLIFITWMRDTGLLSLSIFLEYSVFYYALFVLDDLSFHNLCKFLACDLLL